MSRVILPLFGWLPSKWQWVFPGHNPAARFQVSECILQILGVSAEACCAFTCEMHYSTSTLLTADWLICVEYIEMRMGSKCKNDRTCFQISVKEFMHIINFQQVVQTTLHIVSAWSSSARELAYMNGKQTWFCSYKLYNSKVNNGIMYHKSLAMLPRA